MKKRNFTLVELLIVIGIIGILAGLVLGGVTIAKQRGRITQARADMVSLRTAFEGLYRDYGKMMFKKSGSYYLGGKSFNSASDGCVTIKESSATDAYCSAIAELSDPNNSAFSGDAVRELLLNKRRIKYLDPRPEYDPSKSPTHSDNQENTWLDPWGNPYRMRINVDASETIPDPSHSDKKLSGRIILWSLGPDGKGSDTDADAEDNKDNVAGWKNGDWLD